MRHWKSIGNLSFLWVAVIFTVTLFLPIAQPAAAQDIVVCPGFTAEDEIDIYHEVDFAESIVFHVCWHNVPEVLEATLVIESDVFQQPIERSVDAHPNAKEGDLINLNYPLDLGATLIPAFVTLKYTWTLHFLTEPPRVQESQTIHYIDDAVLWTKTSSDDGTLHVHTAPGDGEVAQIALDIAQASRLEISNLLPMTSATFDPIDLYLYPDVETFQSTLRLTGLDWVAGKASPEIGAMMVPISNRASMAEDLGQRIPHELSHLLLYRAAGDHYASIPAWLDEGLATQFEQPVNSNYAESIANVNNSTQLIPFKEMCVNLPASPPEMALRGYAQSHALVEYMLQTYGHEAIDAILTAAKAGEQCEDTLVNAIGLEKSGDQLAEEWLSSLQPDFFDLRSPLWIGLAFILGTFLIVILVLWGRTDGTRTIKDYNR